jgi:hypothetical protein
MAERPLRGTRPFEALVPGRPWTSKHITLDEQSAVQSRRAPNPMRYKDGTLRIDRPLPEGYSPRAPRNLVLSPRFRHGASEEAPTNYTTTSHSHYARAGAALLPEKGMPSGGTGGEMYELIYGEAPARPPPLPSWSPRRRPGGSPRLQPLPPSPRTPRADDDAAGVRYRHAERVRQLEEELQAESRLLGSARAKVLTKMRWVPNTLDPRALHDPEGQVYGSSWAGFRRPAEAFIP